jgi:hypothetical protein
MTVVLEDQVKTITAEIIERFNPIFEQSVKGDEILNLVRAVIAQYDISSIARLEVPLEIIPYFNLVTKETGK